MAGGSAEKNAKPFPQLPCDSALFFFSLIEVELIYNVVLISAVQQSNSVVYVSVCIYIYILFHYGLSRDTEYSSLCYTVGPCCLSILYITV